MANKNREDKKFLGLWIPIEEYKALNTQAHKQEISLSALVRKLLKGKK